MQELSNQIQIAKFFFHFQWLYECMNPQISQIFSGDQVKKTDYMLNLYTVDKATALDQNQMISWPYWNQQQNSDWL